MFMAIRNSLFEFEDFTKDFNDLIEQKNSLLEIDFATIVRVKGAEDVRAELLSVTLREELLVDLDELSLGQFTARAVHNEALVPDLDLLLGELCILG
jgi:hypothetical protein